MKKDLDSLMKAAKMDALVVLGDAQHNPAMYYFTGGGHINNATLVKPAGKAPILYCNDMEREEAARTGLEVHCFSEIPNEDLLKQAEGDPTLASALRLQRMFRDMGLLKGTISLYGRTDIGSNFATFSALQGLMPEVRIIGEPQDASIFMKAMETKDASEVDHIRRMGKVTTAVVSRVADFLTGSQVDQQERLVHADGKPITIGDVKSRINLWLAEAGVENPHGTIFAIGHDAGVPHSTGTPQDVITLGRTIVFDIYPCEAGGGYHYDFTRTWCLGYAPEKVQKLYQQVLSVFNQVMSSFKIDTPFKEYQKITCDLFEKDGHPTPRSHPGTQKGYVHSLGHGVGLNIHERPWSGLTADENNRLVPGVVATIEPGLYYPEEGMGVRLEDTFYVRPDGRMEVLAGYPLDLVLPMKTWKKSKK